MSHRFVLVAAGAAAAVVFVVTGHLSAAPAPGRTIVWGTPAARTDSSAPPQAPGMAPVPSPSATAAGGPLGGLRNPISGVFSELNHDTQRSASGQFAILQEIAHSVRGWIEGLLNRMMHPH